jgi:hypothetical protein
MNSANQAYEERRKLFSECAHPEFVWSRLWRGQPVGWHCRDCGIDRREVEAAETLSRCALADGSCSGQAVCYVDAEGAGIELWLCKFHALDPRARPGLVRSR